MRWNSRKQEGTVVKKILRTGIATAIYFLLSLFVFLPTLGAYAADKTSDLIAADNPTEWLQKNCSQVFDNKLLVNTFIYLHYTPEDKLQLGTTNTRNKILNYDPANESNSFTTISADSPLGACFLLDDSVINQEKPISSTFFMGYQFSHIKGAVAGAAELEGAEAKIILDSVVDLEGNSLISKFYIGNSFFPVTGTEPTIIDTLIPDSESPITVKASKANIYIATILAEITLKDGTILTTSKKYTFVCPSAIPLSKDQDKHDKNDQDNTGGSTITPPNPDQPDTPKLPDPKPVVPNNQPDPKPQSPKEDQQPTPPPAKDDNKPAPLPPTNNNRPKPVLPPPPTGVNSTPNNSGSSPNALSTASNTPSLQSRSLPLSSSSTPSIYPVLPEPKTPPASSEKRPGTTRTAKPKVVSDSSDMVSAETSPSNKITEWQSISSKVLLVAGSTVAIGGICIYLNLIRKP